MRSIRRADHVCVGFRQILVSGMRAALAFSLVIGVLLSTATRAQDSAPPLLFGVINQQSPIKTAERWNPILSYLTRRTGIPLQLKMGITIEATDAMLAREEFDLAFTNHNFQATIDGKYRVLARWAGPPVMATIVVAENSPIQSLEDLRGRVVAFPSHSAVIGYALPLQAMRQRQVEVVTRFAGTQEGALAQLKSGQVDAAAVNSRFLEDYARRENLRYRRIFVSDPLPEIPIVIHQRVPEAQVATLRRALIGMRGDPDAAPVLLKAEATGFEPATEADYDVVRRAYRMIGK